MGNALIHIESKEGKGIIKVEGSTIDVLDLINRGIEQLSEDKGITYEEAFNMLRNRRNRECNKNFIQFWVFKSDGIDDKTCERLIEQLKKSNDFIDCIDSDDNLSKSWLFKTRQAAIYACYVFEYKGIKIKTQIKKIEMKIREN